VLADIQDRRVEITGPVDRKMIVNALNSGASVFMADFEDANTPKWDNNIQGHLNLRDAIRRKIDYVSPEGKDYKLGAKTATLFVRPRGWHLPEKHVTVDGKPISGGIFDFALYFFHNAKELIARGSGPYFYLPKLESHLEARLWNDLFVMAQEKLGVPRDDQGDRADRNHPGRVRDGRDPLRTARTFRRAQRRSLGLHLQLHQEIPQQPRFLPCGPRAGDHDDALHEKLRRAAHQDLPPPEHPRDGRHGGADSDQERREGQRRRVRQGQGGQGTRSHVRTRRHVGCASRLVSVAKEAFDRLMPAPNQIASKKRDDVKTTAADLIKFEPETPITEAGVRLNINVAIQYIGAWLAGQGAVPIFNLMEDAATAEISRSQVWQWMRSPKGKLADGRKITREMVATMIPEELQRIRTQLGAAYGEGRYDEAAEIFAELVNNDTFVEFLTLPAYERID
jgi:malate synthase